VPKNALEIHAGNDMHWFGWPTKKTLATGETVRPIPIGRPLALEFDANRNQKSFVALQFAGDITLEDVRAMQAKLDDCLAESFFNPLFPRFLLFLAGSPNHVKRDGLVRFEIERHFDQRISLKSEMEISAIYYLPARGMFSKVWATSKRLSEAKKASGKPDWSPEDFPYSHFDGYQYITKYQYIINEILFNKGIKSAVEHYCKKGKCAGLECFIATAESPVPGNAHNIFCKPQLLAEFKKNSKYQDSNTKSRSVFFNSAKRITELFGLPLDGFHNRCLREININDYIKGCDCEVLEDWKDAATFYRKVVDSSPSFAEARVRLAHVLGKEGKWNQAAEALKLALTLNPGKWDWKQDYARALYKSGKKHFALDFVYKLLECELNKNNHEESMHSSFKILREYDDPQSNRDILSNFLDEAERGLKNPCIIAVMCWQLGLPSLLYLLLQKISPNQLPPKILLKLKSFTSNHFPGDSNFFKLRDDNPSTTQPAVVFVHGQADLRILHDISASATKTFVVVDREEMAGKVRDVLRNQAGFAEVHVLRSNIPINSVMDCKIASQSATFADLAVEHLAGIFQNTDLQARLLDYRFALGIGLEDRFYLRLSAFESLRLFIRDFAPAVLLVLDSGKSTPSYLISLLSSNCGKIPIQRVSDCDISTKAAETELDQLLIRDGFDQSRKNQRLRFIANSPPFSELASDFAKNILQSLSSRHESFFEPIPNAVGIVANFHPQERKSTSLVVSVVSHLLQSRNCLLFQRTPFPEKDMTEILEFLNLEITSRDDFKYCFWGGLQPLVNNAKSSCEEWLEPILAELLPESQRAMVCDGLGGNACEQYPYAIVEECLRWFVATEFPSLVLLSLCAEKTLKVSKLISLLVVPEDRNAIARVFTLAAQRNGIKVFNYSFLFLSNYPRYKAPIADILLVPSTYHADYYIKTHNFQADKIRLCGWHAIDASLEASRGLSREDCRARILGDSLDRKLVLFASQPKSRQSVGLALRWLLNACEGLPVLIAIRPHPSESAEHDFYTRLIEGCGSPCRAKLETESSLVEAMVACDLCVTLYSNVGLEAAALDRDVISIFTGEEFPVDLQRIGVAMGCRSRSEVASAVRDLLFGNKGSHPSRIRREMFFKENPALRNCATAQKISAFVANPETLLF
jgi:tetratricopeptide (TPR) repeat protein